MTTSKKPRHLYRMSFRGTRMGSTVCGAKSKLVAAKVCLDCKAKSDEDLKAVNEGLTLGTLSHMEMMLDWALSGPVSSLTGGAHEVMERYLTQSPLWAKNEDDHG